MEVMPVSASLGLQEQSPWIEVEAVAAPAVMAADEAGRLCLHHLRHCQSERALDCPRAHQRLLTTPWLVGWLHSDYVVSLAGVTPSVVVPTKGLGLLPCDKQLTLLPTAASATWLLNGLVGLCWPSCCSTSWHKQVDAQ